MEENTPMKHEEIEIDLQRLFGVLLNKAWLIAVISVLCAAIAFAGTVFLVAPKYQSSVMFYVNNKQVSLAGTTLSLSAADISASRGLVDTYIVILNTRETMLDVADYAGVDYSAAQIRGMISAAAVNETEIFQVVVTCEDPEAAERIADAIGHILPSRIRNIMDGTSTEIVDSAVMPTAPSSPSYTKNTMMGFLVGMVLMCALIVVMDLLDVSIREESDIAQSCSHPVLATVPDMTIRGKGSHGKGGPVLIGEGISFSAAEAYKLLRTKLQFSFVGEGECRVIGISSALTGEGKSLSSVNLAYTISQLGKRVLLIDGDMRRPSVSEKLPVRKAPGLSDYLTGQTPSDSLIQPCGIAEDEHAFHVISSGRIPPNPVELISSGRMEKMLEQLRGNYDYIILDLPPVSEVSDALVAAKLTDGMLLVVRQNYCDRIALSAAVRQFEFIDAKILGMLFNCTSEESGSYGGKYYNKYHKKYGKRYYKTYYGAAARNRDKAAKNK